MLVRPESASEFSTKISAGDAGTPVRVYRVTGAMILVALICFLLLRRLLAGCLSCRRGSDRRGENRKQSPARRGAIYRLDQISFSEAIDPSTPGSGMRTWVCGKCLFCCASRGKGVCRPMEINKDPPPHEPFQCNCSHIFIVFPPRTPLGNLPSPHLI